MSSGNNDGSELWAAERLLRIMATLPAAVTVSGHWNADNGEVVESTGFLDKESYASMTPSPAIVVVRAGDEEIGTGIVFLRPVSWLEK